MSIALVFPGQGSQSVGMGKDFYDNFAEARRVFEEVDEALQTKLSRIIFEGPESDLTLTANTQPAIMATSLAIFRVLQKETGLAINFNTKSVDRVSLEPRPMREAAGERGGNIISYVAGHSLGEYSALAAANSFSISDTAKLLRLRGDSMQKAVPVGEGAMAAILGLDIAEVESVAATAANSDVCQVANDNSPGQAVISGDKAAVERACEIAKERGAKRAVMLAVSAPFHCSLMVSAAEAMRNAFARVDLNSPAVPLIANVTAEEISSPDTIRELLVAQVTGRVRWRESVSYMKDNGIHTLVEIGVGKVLSGLTKRIERDMQSVAIEKVTDIENITKLFAELQNV